MRFTTSKRRQEAFAIAENFFLHKNNAFRNATPRQNGGHGNPGVEHVFNVFLYSLPCPY
jgi:hypothetical protein